MSDLDKLAEEAIRRYGATPSFLNYKVGKGPAFPATVCISKNSEVVHGPGNRNIILKEGDIVGFDIGCWFEGMCTDMAYTIGIGNVSEQVRSLMNVTKASLKNGISAAKSGSKLQAISQAVEDTVKPHGYGIVRIYTGHGVGHEVHEDPRVPNFVSTEFKNPELKEGMVLAIEPMIALGSPDLETAEDGWTAITVDGSIAAHFEQTIVITANGSEILTPWPTDYE